MLKRLILPATLLAFASACHTETSGPGWVDLPADLNLNLPAFRQLVTNAPQPPQSVPASQDDISANTIGADGAVPLEYQLVMSKGLTAMSSTADVGFHEDAPVAFGQGLGTSRGSYYKNTVDLRLTRDGRQIAQANGVESETCNCSHLTNPWGNTANATLAVDGDCGHGASAFSEHAARLDWTRANGSITNLLSETSSGSAHATQPRCPVGGSEYGGNSEGDDWYICYWEDYYDAHGRFIRRVELGCVPFNVQ